MMFRLLPLLLLPALVPAINVGVVPQGRGWNLFKRAASTPNVAAVPVASGSSVADHMTAYQSLLSL
eukprot:7376174-Prymnesium_polylepis.1